MINDAYLINEKCYGCGVCAYVCPQVAITMINNEEGFRYPVVDIQKCIKCGSCIDNCIIENNHNECQIQSVYAASALDEKTIANSTSGGVSYELGKKYIEIGGVVYGAAFTNGFEVKHIRVADIHSLDRIQGTKYVQSNIERVYEQIANDIRLGIRILFIGTPCQVAALKKTFGNYEKLLLVEIVCMGCPSPGVWRDYINWREQRDGHILQVKFRDKSIGWKQSNVSFYFEQGKQSYRATMDEYLQGFGQCLYLRKSCHQCRYKGKKTVGDLKIGDFWGIENGNIPYNSKGTSLVIVETEKGREIFAEIAKNMSIANSTYRFALAANPCIEISKAPSKNRNIFFEDYAKKDIDIGDLIKKHLLRPINADDRFISMYPVVEGLLRLVVNDGIKDFFVKSGYFKVAVYGMSNLGQLFIDILVSNGIEVVCIIDKNSRRYMNYRNIPVVGPEKVFDYDYDCIVVTLVHIYNSVLETLLAQGVDLNKVISLGSVT